MSRWSDGRSRADKLRDLAAHPTTNPHERDRALDELRRMGEGAVISGIEREAEDRRRQEEARAKAAEDAARRWAEQVARARAEQVTRAREAAEKRAREAWAEHEERQRFRREREAQEEAKKAYVAAHFQESRRYAQAPKSDDSWVKRSPFLVRGGGSPMDMCPACRVDSALAVEDHAHDDLTRNVYRCGFCDQVFDVILVGERLMYKKREKSSRSRYGS